MVLEKLLVKIISDFDDSGFEKLESSGLKAEKSAKNLSDSLKKIFFVPEKSQGNKITNQIAGKVPPKTANSFAISNSINGEGFQPYEESVGMLETVPKKKSSFIKNFSKVVSQFPFFFNSNSGEFFFSKKSRSLENIFHPYNTSPPVINTDVGSFINQDKNQEVFLSSHNRVKPASLKSENILNLQKSNFLRTKNLLADDFVRNIFSIHSSISDSSNIMRDMFSVDSVSSTNSEFLPLADRNIGNSASTFKLNSTASENDYSSNPLTLNISQGAIQINAAGGSPKEVGDAVKEALTVALDDFILKRGYTNSQTVV